MSKSIGAEKVACQRLALLDRPRHQSRCRLSGVTATWSAWGQSDAHDPYRTWQYRLLDHVVGADEDRLRDRQPERLGGLEIDHQLELGRLLDRQIGRFRPLQDPVDQVGLPPANRRKAR